MHLGQIPVGWCCINLLLYSVDGDLKELGLTLCLMLWNNIGLWMNKMTIFGHRETKYPLGVQHRGKQIQKVTSVLWELHYQQKTTLRFTANDVHTSNDAYETTIHHWVLVPSALVALFGYVSALGGVFSPKHFHIWFPEDHSFSLKVVLRYLLLCQLMFCSTLLTHAPHNCDYKLIGLIIHEVA